MLVVIETHNIAVFIATSAASAWKHSSAAGAGSCSKLAAALLYNIGVDGLLFMSRVQTRLHQSRRGSFTVYLQRP